MKSANKHKALPLSASSRVLRRVPVPGRDPAQEKLQTVAAYCSRLGYIL